MPAPSTSEEFICLVQKSGLVEKHRLAEFLGSLRVGEMKPAASAQLAGLMIRAGVLTTFQAEALLEGKWKGFTFGHRYKVLERLGANDTGVMYLCEDEAAH